MLPPLSSSEKRLKPPPCVNYFCPVHLSDHGRPSLHLTHVTFSPNGEEVLLSYSGEHVYLMDVNPGGDCDMRYKATDVSKQMMFDSVSNVDKAHLPAAQIMPCETKKSWETSSIAHKCDKLLQYARKCLEEESDYLYAIEACSEVLDGKGYYVEDALRHEFLCTRAALLLKREWKNDVHMAIRDCKKAWAINHSSLNAHCHMAEALSQLGKYKDALEYATVAQSLAPSNAKVNKLVGILRENISAAESEKSSKELDEKKPEERRARSLSELLYRSEVETSDTSQDAPSFEREDSDYDDEMELDFETSISGDEGRDIESGILRGSLNLRFHRRGDSEKYNNLTNGSCGSSSSQNESRFQPEVVIDMKQRYVGHCNVGTDIKQASFLGCKGEYVASGSDDGRWFIWEKRTGRLIKMLAGDENVVNCVQCHPFDCAIATSGIDNTIKLWTPRAQMPSVVAGGTAGPETADVSSAMESNQHKMSRSREPISPFEILERFRMHDFTEGTIHPFECSQS